MQLEVWTRALRCGESSHCVEVRRVAGGMQVRSSQDPDGVVLSFTDAEWDAFVDGVHNGEFDM